MRKALMLFGFLAAFVWSAASYGEPSTRVLVYKGTLKPSNVLIDVNDANIVSSRPLKGYWALRVADTNSEKGGVVDSSAVIYNTTDKFYKVIPDAVDIEPHDPCGFVIFNFNPIDPDGDVQFYAVGSGRLTKFSNDALVAKDFVPKSLKGRGIILPLRLFRPKLHIFRTYYRHNFSRFNTYPKSQCRRKYRRPGY